MVGYNWVTKSIVVQTTDSYPGADVNGAGQKSEDTGSKAQEQTNVVVQLWCYFLPDFFIPPPPTGIQKG